MFILQKWSIIIIIGILFICISFIAYFSIKDEVRVTEDINNYGHVLTLGQGYFQPHNDTAPDFESPFTGKKHYTPTNNTRYLIYDAIRDLSLILGLSLIVIGLIGLFINKKKD